MIFTGFLVAFLAALVQAQSSEEEIPLLVSSQVDGKELQEGVVVPLTYLGSPDTRGRGDIEIEDDQSTKTGFQGYFYPKPSKPFNLPAFRTLDASASIAEEIQEHSRTRRSPYRRPHFPSPPPFRPGFIPSPPPFRPGFIPPHHIRPHPPSYPFPYPYPHGTSHHT